jgi:hypothetical protein
MIPGRTLITRAAPETTDDEGRTAGRLDIAGTKGSGGTRRPFLHRLATVVDGTVEGPGRTVNTRFGGETSDDPGS